MKACGLTSLPNRRTFDRRPEKISIDIKERMFGEHLTARKFSNMVKEIFLKATLYNMFNRMT